MNVQYKIKARIKIIKYFCLVGIYILSTSCGQNLLSDLSANQTSDAALYENIIKKLDAQNYSGTITYILAQSTTFQAKDTTKQYLGEAYLGKCGFTFLDFSSGYGAVQANQLFKKFTFAFTGVTMDPASCDLAQSTLESVSASNGNKNLLLLLTGMTKIGSYLKTNLDTNDDGTVEQNYCTTGGAGPLTDTEVKKAFTGLGLILQNFTGILGNLLGASASAAITTFLSSCEAALGAGNCTITDVANVTDPMALAFRQMLDTASDGFGACVAPACCL